MNTNAPEIIAAANELFRVIGFDPEMVKELRLRPGPEITVTHYIRHDGGELETVTRHIRLNHKGPVTP